MQWDGYFVGSSYYPEQWDETRWEDDFRKMEELGLSVVRMGEFAWAFFEPEEGQFRFDWMDKAIRGASRHGIRTVLCTPTAAVPPWLRQSHPEVLGGGENGPHTYGGRRNYCVNAPAMQLASNRIVTALGEHFAKDPDVLGWQLDNEPGGPFVCYDANCERAFRRWLRQRYGTLEALNAAWGGRFWSNLYDDWNQIELPGDWGPGGKLDYRRFFADSYQAFLKNQADILRTYNPGWFLTTNWPNTTWSLDVYRGGGLLDAVSWDNYPENPGVTAPREQYYSGLNHDICRCAAPGRHFYTAEQGAQVAAHALPEGVRLQSYINLAHGAYGQIYFEWRPPLAGNEQGYLSVLQMDGSFGPAAGQHRAVVQEMRVLGPLLAGADTKSEIALLFSYDNEWAQGFWAGPDAYDGEITRYYKGLKALGRNIDVLSPSADLSAYWLVAAPNLRMVSDEEAARLIAYAEAGGILLLNCQCGTRDMANRLRELIEPGVFAQAAGVRVPQAVSVHAMAGQLLVGMQEQGLAKAEFRIGFPESGRSFSPFTVVESIEPDGAEPLALFSGGRMEGRPAVTVHAFGRGHVVYAGTDSKNLDFYEELARCLGLRFGIAPILPVPRGVEVTSRVKGDTEYVFLLNLTEEPREIPFPEPVAEVPGGTVTTLARLAPLDAKVFSRPKSHGFIPPRESPVKG